MSVATAYAARGGGNHTKPSCARPWHGVGATVSFQSLCLWDSVVLYWPPIGIINRHYVIRDERLARRMRSRLEQFPSSPATAWRRVKRSFATSADTTKGPMQHACEAAISRSWAPMG